jgi:acetyltransferase-like isoleucine patch superfamily enzyme
MMKLIISGILMNLFYGKMIHPLSEVKTSCIGQGTTIWQFCVILEEAVIGKDCNINAHVFIENKVVIGNRVTIKSGVQLWDGLNIADDVFIGPNVTFTNDLNPRSKKYPAKFPTTVIERGASLGANSTILPGLVIGEYSMIGAGAVVTKDVPSRALVVGNPARIIGWLNTDGTRMKEDLSGFKDENGVLWVTANDRLIKNE